MENYTNSKITEPTIKFSSSLSIREIEKVSPLYNKLLKSQSKEISIDLSETENIEEFAFLELVRFRLMARNKYKQLNIKVKKENRAFEYFLDRFFERDNFRLVY